MFELYFLLGFMIIGAIIAVEIKDLLSSVVAVGVVGLGLSLTFLVLKAPDLAIVQLVVEILAVIILIRATVKRDTSYGKSGTGWIVAGVAFMFIAVFLWFSWDVLNDLPDFGSPLMSVGKFYIENGANQTGATNIVTSIILDYRAYDTLGEGTVLFTAVIGVLAVCRGIGRKNRMKRWIRKMIKKPETGMTVIVKVVTRLTVGLILIFGIYIMLHGHLTPGGGFAGGVIIALSFIHMVLAFGKETALKKISKSVTSYFESIGAVMFLSVALLGFVTGNFFTNFLHYEGQQQFTLISSGSILLSNIAICLKVGAGLFAVFLALVFLKTDSGEKK